MNWSRSATVATWVGSLATVVGVIVAYQAHVPFQSQPGQQSFSVPVNASSESSRASTYGIGQREASLNFEVKKCDIGPKLVSCTLTVLSPRYDRRLMLFPWGTRLIDSDGDTFRMNDGLVNLTLERNQGVPFKLTFEVNKDVARPLTVRMVGSIDNHELDKGFAIR